MSDPLLDDSARDAKTRNSSETLKHVCWLIIVFSLLGSAILVHQLVFKRHYKNGDEEGTFLQFIPSNRTISFKSHDYADGMKWAKQIDKFLEAYEMPPAGDKVACKEGQVKSPEHAHIPCAIDVYDLTNCSRKNSQFGYIDGKGQPCIVVQLKQVYNWIPEAYTTADINESEELQEQMPISLQRAIKTLELANPTLLNTTWITCEGESSTDKELIGRLGYFYPGFRNSWNDPTITQFGGIPNNNFPYLKQDAYLRPFLFVKFLEPLKGENVTLTIKCRAWAKNIDEEDATSQFQLHIT